jgi:hypothetical protein
VPIDAGSFQFALGPLIALGAVGLLALFLRWAFGTQRPVRRRTGPVGEDADFGLLTEVTRVGTAAEAHALRAVLSDAGIRSTTSAGDDGRIRVLVFTTEVDKAKLVLGPR